jgi:hypothetical protein
MPSKEETKVTVPTNGTSAPTASATPTPSASPALPDETHLIVILKQASYDAIKEVVERATDRGLESSFDHWLNDAIKAGTQARLRTWNDRDVVTLFKQASQGNDKAKAKLAKLLKMSESQ